MSVLGQQQLHCDGPVGQLVLAGVDDAHPSASEDPVEAVLASEDLPHTFIRPLIGHSVEAIS